ncbi:hypothetical protein ACLBWP_11320 [Microbacterium sp. M1A1_1b]
MRLLSVLMLVVAAACGGAAIALSIVLIAVADVTGPLPTRLGGATAALAVVGAVSAFGVARLRRTTNGRSR